LIIRTVLVETFPDLDFEAPLEWSNAKFAMEIEQQFPDGSVNAITATAGRP
jgi:hypothetical protein